MTLYTLATGSLIADPARRTGAKGDFATATLRTATDDGAILVSVIGFGDTAETLLAHQQGAIRRFAMPANQHRGPDDRRQNRSCRVTAEERR